MSRSIENIAADTACKIRVAYVDNKGPLLPIIIEQYVHQAILEGICKALRNVSRMNDAND
ncbi:hypothetical protein LCGC14_1211410 [marine sediment metagenome]|uniref:Uncharacterized protein n=1 Tax=marine sediment metagenome TaxID=412755 RepID=A0A0F9M1B4_9ZZZZ